MQQGNLPMYMSALALQHKLLAQHICTMEVYGIYTAAKTYQS